MPAIEIRRVRRLYLEVAEDNESARRLYATYEFVQVGRRDGYYRRRDGSVAALTMCVAYYFHIRRRRERAEKNLQ